VHQCLSNRYRVHDLFKNIKRRKVTQAGKNTEMLGTVTLVSGQLDVTYVLQQHSNLNFISYELHFHGSAVSSTVLTAQNLHQCWP
jgi:hypothetical protein